MGTVTTARAAASAQTLGAGISAYLASIDRAESRATHRQYAATLRRFRMTLDASAVLASLDGAAVAGWRREAGPCHPVAWA